MMIIPPVVMLVPLFLLLTTLHMTSTYWGAILVYAGLVTPFSVYLLTNFFKTIPFEIVESALLDGANSWIFWSRYYCRFRASPGDDDGGEYAVGVE